MGTNASGDRECDLWPRAATSRQKRLAHLADDNRDEPERRNSNERKVKPRHCR